MVHNKNDTAGSQNPMSSDTVLEPSQSEEDGAENLDESETSSSQPRSMRNKKMLLVVLATLITLALIGLGLGLGLGVPQLGGKGMSSVLA